MRRARYRSSRAVPKLRVLLAERLRGARHARGLSQARVGELAGLSGKFIGEIERGDKSVSIDSLYRVAAVLKVSLRELLGDASGKQQRPAAMEEIRRLLAGRSDRQLRQARKAIAALFRRSRRTA
jgi:transcriptional regulator with XRE-family HTH domain